MECKVLIRAEASWPNEDQPAGRVYLCGGKIGYLKREGKAVRWSHWNNGQAGSATTMTAAALEVISCEMDESPVEVQR